MLLLIYKINCRIQIKIRISIAINVPAAGVHLLLTTEDGIRHLHMNRFSLFK